MRMRTATAIEKAGSQALLAELLGVTSSAITQWGEAMPQARVWQLRLIKPEWFDDQASVSVNKQAPALDAKGIAAIDKAA